ncbi:hypothetical protein [Actinokineospora bangkokensis]|uniref:Uncharacterized protein n=1 Tax=Actinokineospora bangkokensis TaxID=1193682 RepID=A0A1Q9LSH6_9PSEU|nr:hypothetical protein [Actinokineospora bangkokensis]OLR94996.1 hypothetical protein BJP25_08515 [Actinokineospora bangkokensis]
MRETTYAEFVPAVAKAAVAELAPDELALFDPVAAEFVRDPDRVLDGRPRAGQVLGSGIETVVAALTPIALGVGASVYQHVLDKAGESLVDKGQGVLRKVFRRKPAALPADQVAAAVLNTATRVEVHAVVVARATELGMTAEDAEKLAEAMIAAMQRAG